MPSCGRAPINAVRSMPAFSAAVSNAISTGSPCDSPAPSTRGCGRLAIAPTSSAAFTARRLARRLVAQRDVTPVRPQPHQRHPTRRQRPRLVCADDGRRPKRFDRGQTPHERAAPRHSMHADSERDRGDSGKRFGHGGDGQRDAHFDDEPERRALPGAKGRHQRGNTERQPHKPPAELVEPALQWRAVPPRWHRPACRCARSRSRRRFRSRRRGRYPRQRSFLCRPCSCDRRAAFLLRAVHRLASILEATHPSARLRPFEDPCLRSNAHQPAPRWPMSS